jgi:hypothetical protein
LPPQAAATASAAQIVHLVVVRVMAWEPSASPASCLSVLV